MTSFLSHLATLQFLEDALQAVLTGQESFTLGNFTITLKRATDSSPHHLTFPSLMLGIEKAVAGLQGEFPVGEFVVSVQEVTPSQVSPAGVNIERLSRMTQT